MTVWMRGLLLVTVLACPVLAGAETGATVQPRVERDPDSGLLTIKAENLPLSVLLTDLAQLADIEIWMSDKADRTVSINSTQADLEVTLRRILRGVSYILYYSPGPAGSHVSQMHVIPEGTEISGQLRPISIAVPVEEPSGERKKREPGQPRNNRDRRNNDGRSSDQGSRQPGAY